MELLYDLQYAIDDFVNFILGYVTFLFYFSIGASIILIVLFLLCINILHKVNRTDKAVRGLQCELDWLAFSTKYDVDNWKEDEISEMKKELDLSRYGCGSVKKQAEEYIKYVKGEYGE